MKRTLLFIIGFIIFAFSSISVHAYTHADTTDKINPDLKILLNQTDRRTCSGALKGSWELNWGGRERKEGVFEKLQSADASIIENCKVGINGKSIKCSPGGFKGIVCTNLNITKPRGEQLNCQTACENWGSNGDHLIRLYEDKVNPGGPTSTPTPTPTPGPININYCTELSDGSCDKTEILFTIQGCDEMSLNSQMIDLSSDHAFWNCGQSLDQDANNDKRADILAGCADIQYRKVFDSWRSGLTPPCPEDWMILENPDGSFDDNVIVYNLAAKGSFVSRVLNKNISAGLLEKIPDTYKLTLPTATPTPDSDDIINQLQNRNDDKRGTYGNACWIKPIEVPNWKLPNIFGILGIRDTINELIGNVTQSLTGMMSKPLVALRGRNLCSDQSVATFYNNKVFISDEKTITQIVNEIFNGWDTGNWNEYDTTYADADVTCKCVGRDEILPDPLPTPTETTSNGSSTNVDTIAQVQGVSVSAESSGTVGLIVNSCIFNADASAATALQVLRNAGTEKNQCIKNMCKSVKDKDSESEYMRCLKCLEDSDSYITEDSDGDGCVTQTSARLCRPLQDDESNDELYKCVQCMDKGKGVWTAIGCIYSDLQKTINEQLFTILIGIAGISVLICIVYAGFRMQVSAGNPEKVKAAQNMATSCIMGLILIIFSIAILRIIGVDILRLPSFLP